MTAKKNKPSIAYVMGFMGISGGNRIIYEHANRLARKGLEVKLLHLNDGRDRGWFEIDPKVEVIPFSETEKWINDIDIIIATFNETFWNIIDLPSNIKKAYFVQSDERKFYEKGSLGEYLSNATYTFKNVYYFTEATWMQEWLKDEFQIDAPIFQNKIDPKQFYPDPDPKLKSDKRIVLVEGNVNTPKKGVQDAAEALKEINCEKWLLTNSKEEELPEYTQIFDKIFSLPPQDQIRKIYSSADLLVKPSYFEGSPLPHMEAMACGTAVLTTNCTGVDEYCVHMENSYIVDVGDTGQIRNAIKLLIENKALRIKLTKNGLELAKKSFYDWNSRIDKEIEFFEQISKKHIKESFTLETISRRSLESNFYINHLRMYDRLINLEERFAIVHNILKRFKPSFKPRKLLKRST